MNVLRAAVAAAGGVFAVTLAVARSDGGSWARLRGRGPASDVGGFFLTFHDGHPRELSQSSRGIKRVYKFGARFGGQG